ncbi:MAG TPA: cytochrome c biogenesis protein CcdA [Candidatus Baltobacteraceae bacterium]|jgi:cytochrome c biogenesis protein CcdA|nr:cytochrome c biogenesis protein CcdA [Candidatus Baltobacteraceae bacterium]
MTVDTLAHTLLRASENPLLAVVSAFAIGMVTGIGPCAATRFIALITCIGTRRSHRGSSLASFIAGSLTASIGIAVAIAAVAPLLMLSRWLDALIALGLTVSGLRILLRPSDAHCAHVPPEAPLSLFGIFLLGASTSLVFTPCCAPVLAAIVAIVAGSGLPHLGVALAMSFALGHLVPPIFVASGAGTLTHRLNTDVSSTIGGTLLLALSAYYGLLV